MQNFFVHYGHTSCPQLLRTSFIFRNTYILHPVFYIHLMTVYLVKVKPSVLSTDLFQVYPSPPCWTSHGCLASICIHFHDCSMPVSLSPPRPPITCLSTWLCVSQQTEFTIFVSFSKPQAWLRGAVVEIVQVCSYTFFRGLSFHNSTFSDVAVGWKRINRHHLSALQT